MLCRKQTFRQYNNFLTLILTNCRPHFSPFLDTTLDSIIMFDDSSSGRYESWLKQHQNIIICVFSVYGDESSGDELSEGRIVRGRIVRRTNRPGTKRPGTNRPRDESSETNRPRRIVRRRNVLIPLILQV